MWNVQVIRREVETIEKHSITAENYAHDIINYVKSTWPRIISCIKSYQTVRVLLNHKAHLIEELRKDGLLSEQVLACRCIFDSAVVAKLRARLRERETKRESEKLYKTTVDYAMPEARTV